MASPSEYELMAWDSVQRFSGRRISREVRDVGDTISRRATDIGNRTAKYVEGHPRARSAVIRGQVVAARGGRVIGAGARASADAMPDWGRLAFESMRRTGARVSRVGLSPKRVVSKHQKAGHDVAALADVRNLDLREVDALRGRGASWYYPIAAALSGAGAGLVISGGELAIPVSGGVAAAPSGAAIASAMAGDAAVVLGLASRCVGQVSLLYGYDPEDPDERLFVMSVVNAGTAMSASAKSAAMADLSRLTQALVRGQTWKVLEKSVVTKVSQQFAKAFGVRFTRQSLGKVVPVAGIAVGGALNWATLESIVDAADVAYRRRFLLEKYPQLAESSDGSSADPYNSADPDIADFDATDEDISVLAELAEAGGPDLLRGELS